MIQPSPTLDLVNDYFRFVIAFFEVINTSAPHIYHSALPLSPRTSIVRELYKSYARPLARVVQGFPISWEPVVTTVSHSGPVDLAVWSPCSRFIAIGCSNTGTVEVLDAVTLERLNTLNPLEKTQLPGFPSETTLWLSFSLDSRSLTQFSYGNRGPLLGTFRLVV